MHFGENHAITLGLSEWSPGPNEPNLASVIYATHLGTFANNGVEYFTPWNWFNGMWETMHLFSRYAKKYSVSSTSSLDNTVSAYTTVSDNSDSTTVIIVNRDTKAAHNVNINLAGILVDDGNYTTLQLESLPATETFKSHSNNALKTSSVTVASNSFIISVPALSTTAVLLKSEPNGVNEIKSKFNEIKLYPNPVSDMLYVQLESNIPENAEITIYDLSGSKIQSTKGYIIGNNPITLDLSSLSEGYYLLSVKRSSLTTVNSFAIIR